MGRGTTGEIKAQQHKRPTTNMKKKINKELKFYNYDYSINKLNYLRIHITYS